MTTFLNTLPVNDMQHYRKEGDEKTVKYILTHLHWYHTQLQHQDLLKHCFYDKDLRAVNLFIDMVLDERHLFFLVMHEHKPMAHAILSNIQGKSAMIHFGILRDYHSQAKQAMVESRDQIMEMKRLDGKGYLIETLIGLTPMYNRAARKLIAKAGMQPKLKIPNSAYLYWKDRYVDCMLSMRCRNGGLHSMGR